MYEKSLGHGTVMQLSPLHTAMSLLFTVLLLFMLLLLLFLLLVLSPWP
jgi:hypothetical protein